MSLLQVKFDPMEGVEQDAVAVTFDGGKAWQRIGYMLQTDDAPFNGIFTFSDMAAEDKEEILELIWQQKGKRKANIPKRPPAWALSQEPILTPEQTAGGSDE